MEPALFTVHMMVLGICLWVESVAPFFMDRPNRLLHWKRNLGIGLFNGALITDSTASFAQPPTGAKFIRSG
jgi:hypothetical protein